MGYIVVSIIVGILTCLCMYLDSRLFDKPKKRITYIKVVCMNIGIVLAIIYFFKWISSSSSIKEFVSDNAPKIDGPVVNIKEIGEDMFTDNPPF